MDKLFTIGLVVSAAAGAATQTLRRLRDDADALGKRVAAIGAGRQALERIGRLRDGLAQAGAKAEQAHLAAQRMGEKAATAQAAAARLAHRLNEAKAQAGASAQAVSRTSAALSQSRDRAEALRLQLALARGASGAGAAEVARLRTGLAHSEAQALGLVRRLDQARHKQAQTQAETARLEGALTRAQGITAGFSRELAASQERGRAVRRELDAAGASLARAEDKARSLGLRLNDVQAASAALARQEHFANLRVSGRQDMERGRQLRGEARAGLVDTAAMGYALFKPISAFAKFEDKVKDIAITGEMSREEEANLARSIRATALKYNQYQDAVAEMTGTLVAEGLDPRIAAQRGDFLAKAATANRASPQDLARMDVTFHKVLQTENADLAHSQATKAGKMGSFEVKDMAKWMPELAGAVKGIGLKGNEAVVSLSSRLQISKLGAGSSDTAANNLKNFLSKLTAVDTQKDFKKAFDIDLVGHLQNQAASGKDPVTAGVDLIMAQMRKAAPHEAKQFEKLAVDLKKIKDPVERQAELERRTGMIQSLGERAGLGTMFQDMQAVSYLMTEIQNRGALDSMMKEVREGKGKSGQSVIDEDFDKRMQGAAEQFKALSTASTELMISIGGALAPAAADLATWTGAAARWLARMNDEYPGVVRAVGMFAGGLLAFSMASIVAKWMAGGALSTVGAAKNAWGWLRGIKADRDVQKVYVINMGAGGGLDGGSGKGRRGRGKGGRLRRMGGAMRRGLGRAGGALMRAPGALMRGGSALAAAGMAGGGLRAAGGLAKGALRGLGRLAAPVGLLMSAADVYGAMNDPQLSGRERRRAIGSAVGGGLGGMAGGALAGAAIGSVVPVVGTAIGAVIGGALGYAGGTEVGGWLADKIDSEPVQRAWGAIRSEFEGASGSIAGMMANWSPLGLVYQGMAQTAKSMGLELPPRLSGAMGAVMQALEAGLSSEPAQRAWGVIQSEFEAARENIAGAMVNWSPLGTVYQGMAQAAQSMGVELPPRLTDSVGAMMQALESGVSSGWAKVSARLDEGVSYVRGLASAFMQAGRELVSGLVSGIESGIDAAGSAVGAVASAAVARAKGAFGDLAQAGRDAVVGLTGGVQSRQEVVRVTLRKTADAAVSGFSDALAIRSPSRVFMQLGGFVAEGAALGIRGRSPMAARASALLASGVLAAAAPLAGALEVSGGPDLPALAKQWTREGLPAWVVEPGRTPGVPMGGAEGGARMSGASMDGGRPLSITYAPQIALPPGLGGDGQAVADAVQGALRLSFDEFERYFERLMAERGRRSYDYGGA